MMINWPPVQFFHSRKRNTIIFEFFVMVQTRMTTVAIDNRPYNEVGKPFHHVCTPLRGYIPPLPPVCSVASAYRK